MTGGDPTLIAYSTDSHMPHEWAWNFNIQHQLSRDFVAEVGYNGNKGMDLLAQDLIGRFPKDQFVAANGQIYNNVQVANPVAQTINYPNPMTVAIAAYCVSVLRTDRTAGPQRRALVLQRRQLPRGEPHVPRLRAAVQLHVQQG